MTDEREERTYGLREAGQRLGVSARSVRRYVISGQLPASQVVGVHGLEYRIAESVLDGYAATMATRAMARVRLGSAPLATATVATGVSAMAMLEALTTRQATDAAALERAWTRIAELERELATAQARLSAPASPSLEVRTYPDSVTVDAHEPRLSWRERITGRARGQA